MLRFWQNLSVSKKLYSVVGLMAILVATELFTLMFAMHTLSAVRAFVAGEGVWSKAQKDAIHSLYQYAIYGQQENYDDFQSHLKIASGDHIARTELSKPNPDLAVVRQGFLDGGNDPSDIDGMIKLLMRFGDNRFISSAISAWTSADLLIEDLRVSAEELKDVMSKPFRRPEEIAAVLNRISTINDQMTKFEGQFSASLGAGSRWMENLLMMVLVLTVFTVESTGLYLTFRFSRNLSSSLKELMDTAGAVGVGNFSVQAPVRSKDELGQLAESLNRMIADLRANVDDRTVAEKKLKRLNEELEERVSARAKETLKRESQLRVITNALPELVAQLDQDKRFLFANEAFCKWSGMALENIIGKSVMDIFPNDGKLAHGPNFDKVLAGQIVTFESLSKDHLSLATRQDQNFNVTLVPEVGDGHQVVGCIFVAVDVTKYKKIEEELMRAKEIADTANATKSAFLANMSHEIRTPLGVIIGFSELIANQEMTPSERANGVEVIKRNGDLLSKVINDILDLSKVEAGKMGVEIREAPLKEILADVSQPLRLKAEEKGVSFGIFYEGLVPENIKTDPFRLRQILLNIAGNAIKFTEKGSVNLNVRYSPSDENHSTLKFIVSDTGKGIEVEDIKKLFLPFSQADSSAVRKFGGTGLGLILSKKLAKLLGGDVTLTETEFGKGSVFSIEIAAGPPGAYAMPNVAVKKKTKTATAGVLDGIKTLLVEDSADNQMLISHMLKHAGAKVEISHNGRQAIDRTDLDSFDVILMDLQMPVMNGYEATEHLRGRGYLRPIVAITAHALVEEKERCLASGFNDHITKPIKRELLVDCVRHFARKKRASRPKNDSHSPSDQPQSP